MASGWPRGSDTRAVLFDMDGLLLDTEVVAQAAFVEVTADIGLGNTEAATLFLELVGSSSHQTRSTLRSVLPQDTDFGAFDAAWTKSFLSRLSQEIPVKASVSQTLATLAGQGRKMAVVTSTHTVHARDHLDRGGLLDHFITVIGGDAVTSNKPDPAPYFAGADAVGEHPENCVAFEDSDRGTASAIAAGCQVWQIPDLRPPNRPLPTIGQNLATTLEQAARAAGLL